MEIYKLDNSWPFLFFPSPHTLNALEEKSEPKRRSKPLVTSKAWIQTVGLKENDNQRHCGPFNQWLKVPILPAHIISVNHGVPAESAAEDYEFSIRQLVRNRTVDVSRSSDCPRFDLILLVLGSDGHVASLFPCHPVVDMESQWVAAISDAPRESITLTLPVINSAANVAIVATGSDVAKPLASAISDDLLPHGSHPAQLVSPGDGKLVWFADASAASLMAAENS